MTSFVSPGGENVSSQKFQDFVTFLTVASDLTVCPSLPHYPGGIAVSAVFLLTEGVLVIAAAI